MTEGRRGRPERWALWVAGTLVGSLVVLIEYISVLGITLGLFYERLGLRAGGGWGAVAATLAVMAAATWGLAVFLTRFDRHSS